MTSTATKKKITAALFALTLPFGLAACGDDSEESEESDSQSQEADGGNTLDPDGGDSEDPEVGDSEDPDDQDSDDTDTNSGDRASKDEFHDGMKDLLTMLGATDESLRAQGLDDEQIDGYYSCITDIGYDDLSEDFVNDVADIHESAKMSPKDQDILYDVAQTCSTEFGIDMLIMGN